jgi:tol-pal system protein YbgF
VNRVYPTLLVLSLFACGRGENAEERELAKMREALTRVQSRHDGIDQRLAQLEVKNADASPSSPATSKSAPIPTPPLKVVRITPEDAPDDPPDTKGATPPPDPEDMAPRPSIRVTGAGGAFARGKRTLRGPDNVEATDPTPGAEPLPSGPMPSFGISGDGAGARPSAQDPAARRGYDDALALVYAKKYDAALDAFAAFLVKWPDHPNADNAHYWRGECYFAKGELARAEEQFAGVIARFPLGNKASDALLKAGMCRQRHGDGAGARQYFERLGREFPRSEASRRIPREENK